MDVKDKVVVVTGGSNGIGFITVQAFLKNGAKHVAIFDLQSRNNCIEELDKKFGKGKTSFWKCDVTKSSEFAVSYDDVVKLQKTVDVLVNCAGIFDENQGDRMIDINFKGLINCTLTAFERMRKNNGGNGGVIVNLSSIVGIAACPPFPIYTATKYGVYGFTLSFKHHYEYTGVRVVGVCPGLTQTGLIPNDMRKISQNFVEDKLIDSIVVVTQKPEFVAETIIRMVKDAESGAIWLIKDGKSYVVKDIPYRDKLVPI